MRYACTRHSWRCICTCNVIHLSSPAALLRYFDQSRLGTRFRDGWYCDGGITNFIPVPPDVERAVRVCCLPGKNVGMTVGIDIDIAPESRPHGWPQMVAWALEPGTEGELLMLQELGRTDTQKWIAMARTRGRDMGGGQMPACLSSCFFPRMPVRISC